MSRVELVVRSRRVVTPAGVVPATVVVAGGRVRAIEPHDAEVEADAIDDCGALAVLPGAVDTHVHVNEPGRTDWEGFASATRAAAAGGVTTLVDMPLNSIPATTSATALEQKRRAAEGNCRIDVGFWGGVVPGNTGELAALADAGALGFKAFLAPSGVPEFAAVDAGELERAAVEIARLGSILLVHAESAARLELAGRAAAAGDRRAYATWLGARPVDAEVEAVELVARVAAATRARLHVVHLSSGAGLEVVTRARASGAPITAETCPHYLSIAAEDIADGAVELKCAPPIRAAAERERLWRGLADGTIELVASDHSPAPPELKRAADGDFLAAWGGIASLQVALAVVWTEARARGFGLERLAGWCSAAPARLAGLASRKGSIAPGRDADLVVFDPEASFTVEPERLYHRHPMTPYAGRTLAGRIVRTYLRGAPVYDDGRFAAPAGELLRR